MASVAWYRTGFSFVRGRADHAAAGAWSQITGIAPPSWKVATAPLVRHRQWPVARTGDTIERLSGAETGWMQRIHWPA